LPLEDEGEQVGLPFEIGRMSPAEAAGALARLSTGMTLNALGDRDIVIQAIIENEEAKVNTYRQVQKVLRTDAILASNPSTISITRMAQSVERPEQFAGMHFFNPVDRMQLVEVIRGDQTSDETVVTLVALAKRIGKTPIVVRDCSGFLVNRILFPYLNKSLVLLQEGANPRHRQSDDGVRHADGADHAQRSRRPGYVAVRRPGHQHRFRRSRRADAHSR
jgi:3-hydroxyacyl-CoA dehydrogenase